jgi:hypothetical protein
VKLFTVKAGYLAQLNIIVAVATLITRVGKRANDKVGSVPSRRQMRVFIKKNISIFFSRVFCEYLHTYMYVLHIYTYFSTYMFIYIHICCISRASRLLKKEYTYLKFEIYLAEIYFASQFASQAFLKQFQLQIVKSFLFVLFYFYFFSVFFYFF